MAFSELRQDGVCKVAAVAAGGDEKCVSWPSNAWIAMQCHDNLQVFRFRSKPENSINHEKHLPFPILHGGGGTFCIRSNNISMQQHIPIIIYTY